MTEYEAYQEHIRYTHDTYCRIVIRHASFDAARMLAARWKREISLEYLTEEKFVPLSTISQDNALGQFVPKPPAAAGRTAAVFFWKEVCSRLQLISGPTRWRLGKALSRQWRNALTMGLIRKSWEPCPHTSAIRPRLPLSFCW